MLRQNLLQEMGQIQRQFNQIFYGGGLAPMLARLTAPDTHEDACGGNQGRSQGRVAVNLREDAKGYYLEALLPGIEMEQLKLELTENVLSLSGAFNAEPLLDEEIAWHRRERPSGQFQRKIELPEDVDVEKVSADYHQGLLRVTLPKVPAAVPKKIAVQIR
ncbi:MAG: Hsp20/alpha crystallin family protein [Desulfuromonadales bacterium]|nr:Hsp20/alpha crystallin family protein [Desulfuromonadales bacterium]